MSCPFCLIAAASPPAPSPTILTSPSGSSTYLALSTPLVVAFLDIAPVSRGHLLVCPRAHYGKSTEIPSLEAAAVGFWIPVLGRAVMRAVWGERGVEGSWNVVQANGAEAGQTVPHVHFHVIPRAGDEAMAASDMGDAERRNIALGEGPRERLEEEEGELLVGLIQTEVEREVRRLRGEGEVVDGEGDGELWLRVEKRGLKL